MAGRRPIALAAVAVVLLLCLTGAAAADTQDVKGIDADHFNAKAEFAMAAIAAVAPQHKSKDLANQAAAAAEPLKQAAAAEPQHAPQFPEDPQELKRKSQPAAPTPADSASKEAPKQQPAATPSPAAAAPQKPQEQQQKEEEPKKEEPKKEEEKEDICTRVPGCLECKPFDPHAKSTFGAEFTGGMRRLAQHKGGFDGGEWGASSIGTLGGSKTGKKGKPDFNFMTSVVESPYNAKDLPVCTSCNTTAGYVNHSRGRCACAAGYGDTTPTGNCHRCPNGFFSLGGFRAVCVECEGVAFSNADHTACVCASGWYGVTSYGTKQASCNQCPGTRPVSPEGARAVSECIACPEGLNPNEIFSECVDPTKIPPPSAEEPPRTPFNLTKAPDVQPLFNESTFANAKKDWIMTTRNTQNHSNIFSDFLGSIMDSVVMGKNISATAARPGDLLYQVLTKPTAAPAKLPTLPSIDVQNPAAIGAGIGAALSTVPAVLGAAAQNGGKISDVVDSVVKAVETGSKAGGGDMAPAGGNGWEAFIKGFSATAPKDGSGKSEVADFAKSLGDLFGAAGKAASQVAEKSDNSLVKSISGLLSAAKKGDIQVPLSGEAALIAAPEPSTEAAAAPAEASNSWGSMLQGLLGGSSAAAAPAAPADAPAGATDWSKLLSGFAKAATPTPAAAGAPAASGINNMQQMISGLLSAQQAAAAAGTPAPSASSTDITKLLSSLTSPTARKVDTGRPQHTITTEGVHYVSPTAGSEQQPSSDILPSADSVNVPDIMAALAKLGGQKKEVQNIDGDILEHTQQVIRGSANKPAVDNSAAIGNLLGGLFGGQKSGTISFSNGMGSKVKPLQATQATALADGFISVPSAPPKGSHAIKSGKFFAKANVMKNKAKKQQ